jgi:hypothetical protein
MARREDFTVSATTPATPEAVFSLVCDGASWPTWSPIGSFRLERSDEAGGEGVGAIRVFSTGTVRSREEIIEVTEGVRFSYVALSGLPMRHHRADIELRSADGTTTVSWHEAFEPRWPATGRVMSRLLRRFVQRSVDGLAKESALVGERSAR